MEKDVFICACGSDEHQAIFRYFEDIHTGQAVDAGDYEYIDKELYVNFHLHQTNNFFRRLVLAFKYLFKFDKFDSGCWCSFIFDPQDAEKVINYFQKIREDGK